MKQSAVCAPMRAACLTAFVSLLLLLVASAVAEECGCSAHAASDHIELDVDAAPTASRERVFEEAAKTAQEMREIRMKGGFVTYGTVDAIIYVDQEGSWRRRDAFLLTSTIRNQNSNH